MTPRCDGSPRHQLPSLTVSRAAPLPLATMPYLTAQKKKFKFTKKKKKKKILKLGGFRK
jgi:hypothetical protein